MNSVFENNFQAGFTPFSSLLVFKDFAFCLYGDVLRRTGFTTTTCSATDHCNIVAALFRITCLRNLPN